MLSLIAAIDKNRVIGLKNRMPWHLPADLKHFKRLTLGKPVVMGRKTFESIGQALPERLNVILSRQSDFFIQTPGCRIFSSLDEALTALALEPEIMIIGGAQLFERTLPLADKMYLTVIDYAFEGDAFFPRWEPREWRTVSQESHFPNEKNSYSYCFLELQRIGTDAPQ